MTAFYKLIFYIICNVIRRKTKVVRKKNCKSKSKIKLKNFNTKIYTGNHTLEELIQEFIANYKLNASCIKKKAKTNPQIKKIKKDMDPLPSYVRIHPTMLKQSTTQVHFHHVKSSSIDDANESYISQNKQSSVIISKVIIPNDQVNALHNIKRNS